LAIGKAPAGSDGHDPDDPGAHHPDDDRSLVRSSRPQTRCGYSPCDSRLT